MRFLRTGRINMANNESERQRILLVEDHEDAWELVTFSLSEYILVCARDFTEGLRLARQRSFDLYILRCCLPDGTGVELCRHIRKFDPATPILFYSTAAYTHDMQEAFHAGAQAYLTKPVRFGELKQAVAQLTALLGNRDSEAQLAELTAIREELAIRQIENAERIDKAKERLLRSKEKALRLKAEAAFLAAGGTRGDFARRWPSLFAEEVRNHRDNRERGATDLRNRASVL